MASPKAPSVEIGSAGNAKVGGDEIGLAGGKGWSVRKAGVGTTPEKLESVVPRDHDSERGGLLAPEEPDKGEPMVAERQAGGLVQEPEAVPRLSGRVEPSPSNEASATPEDSPEHVGLSQAEMCALWNEDVEEQPRAQELGGAGLFTPEGSQGGQPQSVEQGPSLGSFAGRESLVGGWQGSGLGVDVRRSESPESSAAEQELFLRISSQRSPFAPPVLPSSGFLRETQGLGAVPSLGRDSLPAHLSNLSAWKDSPRTVDSGSAGADFYRQLAHTLTPDRAAAFASGTGGVSAAATGGLVRVRLAFNPDVASHWLERCLQYVRPPTIYIVPGLGKAGSQLSMRLLIQ